MEETEFVLNSPLTDIRNIKLEGYWSTFHKNLQQYNFSD